MIRGMTVLWAVLAVLAGVAMFMVKYEVQALEESLRQVNGQIRADRRQIHVLEAEWAYLNQPDRLRELAEKHLNLKTLEPAQVITMASLPPRPLPDGAPDDPSGGNGNTVLSRAPDGALILPWATYPVRKPGTSTMPPQGGTELASTGGPR